MSDSWRLAKSLIVLTSEIEYFFPDTTIWDIGDASHQSEDSDHNPNECCDVVCAVDVKPDHGLDLPKFVHHLVTNPHPNLRYVIFNRKIYHRKYNFEARDYNGVNAHKEHVHVSAGNGPDGRSTRDYDSTASWEIDDLGKPAKPSKPHEPAKPSKPSTGTKKLGDKMPTLRRGDRGKNVRRLQGLLTANGYATAIDGKFEGDTERQVRAFQHDHARPVDGIPGPITWNALLGL
jgi:ribosomal protein S17